jgi:hypothetical protein
MLVVGFFLLAAFVNGNPEFFLKRDGPLGRLMNKRIAKPSKGFFEVDLVFIGPLNEFLSLSVMEVIGFSVLLAWLAIAVWARYKDLLDENLGVEYQSGNHARAFGRGMTAAALRLMLVSLVSPNRNTVFIHFLGIPFERALKWHKICGRLMVVCMYVHMIAMLIGGTEEGYVRITGERCGFIIPNPRRPAFT